MNRLHLFIDTNIFLNLYHFSDDDLEELNKVIVLLESNNIVIYTTNQLINEFYRNRDEKLREALEATKKIFPTTQFPNIYKSYSEYEEIKELLKKFSNAKSRLDDRLLNDIFAKRLKADIIIEHIIEESKKLSPDNNIIDKAKERLDLGNPPGKKGSYGDAINWELLLKGVTPSIFDTIDSLYFITQDKDYISVLDLNKFNTFLSDEWLEKKGFPIVFYTKLTDFFRDKFPDINLATELYKSLSVEELCHSGSFRTTKRSISKLLSIAEQLTGNELNRITSASISNNQIHWISTEVKDDLNLLIGERRSEIDSSILETFDNIYNPFPQIEEHFTIEKSPF